MAGDVDASLKVQDLARPADVPEAAAASRLDLLRGVHDDFAAARPGAVTKSHALAYDRAARLMQSSGGKVFDLTDREGQATRDKLRPQPVRSGVFTRPPVG